MYIIIIIILLKKEDNVSLSVWTVSPEPQDPPPVVMVSQAFDLTYCKQGITDRPVGANAGRFFSVSISISVVCLQLVMHLVDERALLLILKVLFGICQSSRVCCYSLDCELNDTRRSTPSHFAPNIISAWRSDWLKLLDSLEAQNSWLCNLYGGGLDRNRQCEFIEVHNTGVWLCLSFCFVFSENNEIDEAEFVAFGTQVNSFSLSL